MRDTSEKEKEMNIDWSQVIDEDVINSLPTEVLNSILEMFGKDEN